MQMLNSARTFIQTSNSRFQNENGVVVFYTGDWGRLRTLTVKPWTEVAEEAAAMLNSATPPAIGRRTSGETAAAARGMRGLGDDRWKGLARRVL